MPAELRRVLIASDGRVKAVFDDNVVINVEPSGAPCTSAVGFLQLDFMYASMPIFFGTVYLSRKNMLSKLFTTPKTPVLR